MSEKLIDDADFVQLTEELIAENEDQYDFSSLSPGMWVWWMDGDKPHDERALAEEIANYPDFDSDGRENVYVPEDPTAIYRAALARLKQLNQ